MPDSESGQYAHDWPPQARPDNCRWCQQNRRRAGSLYCSRLCEDFGRTMRAETKRCLRIIEGVRVRACKCADDPTTHCDHCHVIGRIDDKIRKGDDA